MLGFACFAPLRFAQFDSARLCFAGLGYACFAPLCSAMLGSAVLRLLRLALLSLARLR
jgi:hypothetical protein